MHQLIPKIQQGFSTINIADNFKQAALQNIEQWLTEKQFKDYVPQIEYLCEQGDFDLLLDCFYQLIPFGTAGRRGMVGIGPNRINPFTIMASAQGHSHYLIKIYGEAAKTRGVVMSYDVRQYLQEGVYNDEISNPVKGLTCKDLAYMAAEVYAANGLKVYLFKGYNSLPELSFMVRDLHAVAGGMISASHNPPEFNGKKVVDDNGGQLTPPYDEKLVEVVRDESDNIITMPIAEAEAAQLIEYISEEQRQKYLKAAAAIDFGNYRGAKILYSPFHGTGYTSVFPVLQSLGFDVTLDPASSVVDPRFSTCMYNLPNPEVREAYLNLIPTADNLQCDLIMVSDPDADRFGLMSKEADEWHYYSGNEIMVLATSYMLEEMQMNGTLRPEHTIVKTLVTTNFLTALAQKYNVKIIGDLLVGFKYIAEVMNNLQAEGKMDDFLIGGEESNGTVNGSYIRDKDSCCPAIYIAELASREKAKGRTLLQYLNALEEEVGCFYNYLTEIRLLGAEGMSNIAQIQTKLRANLPEEIGVFKISEVIDRQKGEPFLSDTDKIMRDVLVFRFNAPASTIKAMQVSIRPSGTEPKSKMYFEVSMQQDSTRSIAEIQAEAADWCAKLEKDFMKYMYKLIGINFPDRGFLLFWQIPGPDKMKYFEIEPQIAALQNIEDSNERKEKLMSMLKFLGANPIEKVDKAFTAEYSKGINSFLNL